MSSVTIIQPIRQHDNESPIAIAPETSSMPNGSNDPGPRISQSTMPESQIGVPNRKVNSVNLSNRKGSSGLKTTAAFLAGGAAGFAGRDLCSETTLIGSKALPIMKPIGKTITSWGSSLINGISAHPCALVGTLVGCAVLGVAVHCMRKFITPKVNIPKKIKELAKSHLGKSAKLMADAKNNPAYRLSMRSLILNNSSSSLLSGPTNAILSDPSAHSSESDDDFSLEPPQYPKARETFPKISPRNDTITSKASSKLHSKP
ncbi:MAG: hypothetical protein LBF94_00370 [Puniceicoccales bacterium]|jgi:hypothetical protein|nr:hypothetical protein [Puniceicoccales bacterium]